MCLSDKSTFQLDGYVNRQNLKSHKKLTCRLTYSFNKIESPLLITHESNWKSWTHQLTGKFATHDYTRIFVVYYEKSNLFKFEIFSGSK